MVTLLAPTIGGGRYRVLSRLGEGGQAAVFRVLDHRLGVERAMKVLLPQYASRAKIRSRFASEARAMARLEHPNIVRVYDVEPDARLPYLVMEVLHGGSLARWLERGGMFPHRQAVEIALEICAGTAAAHAAGIVHRDIKPHNVLVAADGSCKLTDFGIARVESGHRTRSGAAMGTQGYMAPEQRQDASAATERCDIYSIGITLFVLATGRDPVAWLSGGATVLPPLLRSVIERATAPAPTDRYPDVAALAAALRALAEVLPDDARRIPLDTPMISTTAADGEDAFEELTLILDGATSERPPSPDQPPRPSPTYVMWRPSSAAPHQHTPDYVDREASRPERPSGFVIGLDESEKLVSREARRRRASSAPTQNPRVETLDPTDPEPPSALLDDLGRFALQVLGAALRPTLVLPLVALLALLLLGGGGTAWWTVRSIHSEQWRSRSQLHLAIQTDKQVINDLVSLGAEEAPMERLYEDWHSAREPQRTRAAVLLVEHLQRELDTAEGRGRRIPDRTRHEIARLREALESYQRASRSPLAR